MYGKYGKNIVKILMSYIFRVVSLTLRTKHLYTSLFIIIIVIRKKLE